MSKMSGAGANSNLVWRKGKEKSLIDFNKLDSFIDEALQKYEYYVASNSLYKATGNHAYYIINNNSLIPDLVIFNEQFNKNLCFYDFKGSIYNPYPRKKFVLDNPTKSKKKKLNKNNKSYDGSSFEEDPQWVDVDIGELDNGLMKFSALPNGNNVCLENKGNKQDNDASDMLREFNESTDINKENNQEDHINQGYSSLQMQEINILQKQAMEGDYMSNFNHNLFMSSNNDNNTNNSMIQDHYTCDYNFNMNIFQNNDTSNVNEESINNKSQIDNNNISNDQGPNENNSEKHSKRSSVQQPSLMNNFNMNIMFSNSVNNSRIEQDHDNETNDNINSSRKLSVEEVILSKMNKDYESKEAFNNIMNAENNDNNDVTSNSHSINNSNEKSKLSRVQNNPKYYVNNNFTNIHINMNPNNLMNSMQNMPHSNNMNFPFHLLNYNMGMPNMHNIGQFMNKNMNINNMPMKNIMNMNSNMNNVSSKNSDSHIITHFDNKDNKDIENEKEKNTDITEGKTITAEGNTKDDQESPNKSFNSGKPRPNVGSTNNNYSYNNFVPLKNKPLPNQMYPMGNMSNQFNHMNQINQMNYFNQQYQNMQNAFNVFQQQQQQQSKELSQSKENDFIENPSQVIVKNMYTKNWFVVTEKEKLINFSSIELLDFLEMYYKAEKRYEILHIHDYQSDMYFNPTTLLENLREVVPSYKFKMPTPNPMMNSNLNYMMKMNMNMSMNMNNKPNSKNNLNKNSFNSKNNSSNKMNLMMNNMGMPINPNPSMANQNYMGMMNNNYMNNSNVSSMRKTNNEKSTGNLNNTSYNNANSNFNSNKNTSNLFADKEKEKISKETTDTKETKDTGKEPNSNINVIETTNSEKKDDNKDLKNKEKDVKSYCINNISIQENKRKKKKIFPLSQKK